MRVRCDRCGNKALVAASQCPHCGNLLDIRDGFGELLPLVHCTTCDTHYPARQGECRWCGTKPEGFRFAPFAWKGAGVIACIGLGWGAWAASRGSDGATLASNGESTLTTVVDSGTTARRRAKIAVGDTALDSLLAQVATHDSAAPMEFDTVGVQAPTYEPVSSQTTAPLLTDSASSAATLPGPTPAAPMTSAPPRRTPSASARVPTASKVTVIRPARATRWVRATARNWVIVRASASRGSRVIASIGPDTRVQLGEARGDWIRIRMKGINGWVERSRF